MATAHHNQKVGFEVEFYSPLERDAVQRRMNVHRISNYTLISDASLQSHSHDNKRYVGHEMIFTKPVSINHVGAKFDEAFKLLSDERVGARHVDDTSFGSTGLHLHFGLVPEVRYGMLDFLRLLVNTVESEKDVARVSGRGLNRWARSLVPVKDSLDEQLHKLKLAYAVREKSRTAGTRYPNCNDWEFEKCEAFAKKHFEKNYLKNVVASIIGCEEEYDSYKKWFQEDYVRSIDLLKSTPLVNEWIEGEGKLRGRDVQIGAIVRDGAKLGIKWAISGGVTHTEIQELLVSSELWKFKDGRMAIRPTLAKWKVFGACVATMNKLSQNQFKHVISHGKPLMELYKLKNGHEDEVVKEYVKHEKFNQGVRDAVNRKMRVDYDAELSKGDKAFIRDFNPNWFDCMRGYDPNNNRYFGVNATNIGYMDMNDKKKINTIEFRWGSSTLMESQDKFNAFYNFCHDLYVNSFTGEKYMAYGEYVLKDITHASSKAKHVIAVFHNGKMIGRLHNKNLDTRPLYVENGKFAHEIKSAMASKSNRAQLLEAMKAHKAKMEEVANAFKSAKKHLSKQKKQIAIESVRKGAITQLKATLAPKRPTAKKAVVA